jgi:phosphocarrier protein FPr
LRNKQRNAPFMIQLSSENIQLNASAVTKEDAIRAAGQNLIDTGNIDPAYVESMLGREQQANTFLGNGIAIPHGMGKDRELIHQTGVCVVQTPDGVEWNPGQIVHIVIGIAAKSDEHLGILAALTELLDDPSITDRLANTNDPEDIIASLSQQEGGPSTSSLIPIEALSDAQQVNATLRPGAGLHARPATNLVAIADSFTSEIHIVYNGKVGNAKAMASLLKLNAEGGETLQLMARGEDADLALATLKQAIESGLGDEDEIPIRTDLRSWEPTAKGTAIKGVCASPGIKIGPLHHFKANRIVVSDTTGEPEVEWQKLRSAIARAKTQLHELYDSMTSRVGKNEAAIFRAHEAFLTDPDLFDEAAALIKTGHSAAWSWQQAIESRVSNMKRATDLYDVGQRVLRLLTETGNNDMALPDEPCILVADDLMPSDTTKLDPKRILGFVTAAGGPTSHTAIIARSLGIPAIVGTGKTVLELTEGTTCILEGTAGTLYTEPTVEDLASARQFELAFQRQREEKHTQRYQPALMTDGHRVEIAANIGRATDAVSAVDAGAEGVGLLRTEFLFLERDTPPTEDEQFETYSEMTRALGGLPLIIRTLDIGGDKVVPYLSLPKEDNPFLGIRGIRLCLNKPDLFLPQLRAIYRASLTGPIKIMFPMVTTLDDLRAAKAVAEQVRAELNVPPVDIGIMVEVPSVAMLAAEFAKECDFFSIGTNDLTQYTLAMDRLHPTLGSQVDGLNPAVLRLIDQTVRGAHSQGKWVGVCGGIAGDPLGATILVGLGIKELSMSIPAITEVKAQLRGISLASAQDLARRSLACRTAAEVHALGR